MAKIAYVAHPVTPEVKAKLRAEGYRILNARFAPAGEKIIGQGEGSPPQPAVQDQPTNKVGIGVENFTDRELRDIIRDETGTPAGPRTSRGNLEAQAAAALAAKSDGSV